MEKKIKDNFIYKIIKKDLKKKKYFKIKTRFSPEPNGNLHIGHANSIYLNYNIIKETKGKFNIRFDDTNPNKEKKKYIKSIIKDIKWLGIKINKIKYTSNYFNKIYKYAKELIKKKLAYVDKLNIKETKNYRGNFIKKGINSPYRKRSIKKNLKIFKNMKKFKYKEGEYCLRAKINMSSQNIIMRDPILYRIKYKKHYKTNNKWCIYPTYDLSHCISDSIEKITHSLCTLEFQNNKYLYYWILNNINIFHYPNQYEFSRLNIEYNILSKRKLNILKENKIIKKLNDPRLLTISGLKNRGYTSNSIKNFCQIIGITKKKKNIKYKVLKNCIRKDLNNVQRNMAILNPLKVIIKNLPKNFIKELKFYKNPIIKKMGFKKIYFTREIYIDKNDFKEKANKYFRRLILGKKVRLRHSCIIKAKKIIKNKKGKIKYLICKCYLKTINKKTKNKIKGIIHWISKKYSIPAKFYLFKKIFNIKNPEENKFLNYINKKSVLIKRGFVEKNIKKEIKKIKRFQFEREGYFIYKKKLSKKKKNIIFYRIVELKKKYKNK